MKIHIIGGSGAGKSYLAGVLGEKLSAPVCALDTLFWEPGGFSVKREPAVRDAMLREVLAGDGWIIEGVQYAWLGESFAAADVIVLLETSPVLCRFRIVRRFARRKLTGTARQNENLRSLRALLRWTRKFYRVNLPEIRELLAPYREKVTVLRTKREVRSFLNGQE